MKTQVELTIRYNECESKTLAIDIPEDLARELLGTVEWSEEPFSLFVASPGAFGGHGSALTFRKRTFKMRRRVAEDIAKAMVPTILKAFGVNDELDGYRISEMSQEERAFYVERGRLPPGSES